MSIFNKTFDDIKWAEIEDLLARGVAESTVLDYKSEAPDNNNKIARLISAFANTYGGFIVFGVKCKEKTGQPEEIIGFDQGDKDYQGVVESICYDSITPPVFIESKWVPEEDGKRRVFVVKVQESDLTPHAVDDNTHVYVRVNSQKRKFQDEANLDRQKWLWDRRQKHVDFRQLLRSKADEVVDSLAGEPLPGRYVLRVGLVPQYPRELLIKRTELDGFLERYLDSHRSRHAESLIHFSERIPTKDGRCLAYYGQGETPPDDRRLCLYFDCFGTFKSCWHLDLFGEPTPEYVQPSGIASNLYCLAAPGLELLEGLGYSGSVLANAKISGIRGTSLTQPPWGPKLIGAPYRSRLSCPIESEISIERVLSRATNWSEFDQFVKSFFSDLAFSYGVRYGADEFAEAGLEHARSQFKKLEDESTVLAPTQ